VFYRKIIIQPLDFLQDFLHFHGKCKIDLDLIFSDAIAVFDSFQHTYPNDTPLLLAIAEHLLLFEELGSLVLE
jgi:hypothetical protein